MLTVLTFLFQRPANWGKSSEQNRQHHDRQDDSRESSTTKLNVEDLRTMGFGWPCRLRPSKKKKVLQPLLALLVLLAVLFLDDRRFRIPRCGRLAWKLEGPSLLQEGHTTHFLFGRKLPQLKWVRLNDWRLADDVGMHLNERIRKILFSTEALGADHVRFSKFPKQNAVVSWDFCRSVLFFLSDKEKTKPQIWKSAGPTQCPAMWMAAPIIVKLAMTMWKLIGSSVAQD